MAKGCNEITDQRLPNIEDTPPLYNTQILMNGFSFFDEIEVHAEKNFWDEHPIYPLEVRFGEDLIVYYEPYLTEPCPEPDIEGDRMYVKSKSGEIVDTVFSIDRTVGSVTAADLLYATAEEKFISADYAGAEDIYNQIVYGSDSLKVKLKAFKRLYEIGKLSSKPVSYFDDLNTTFASVSQSVEDSVQKKIFNQLATLSLIGKEEYVPAIGEFDQIIQQNPNTEEAVYAEIDALTTALLVEGGDSTLQKSSLGKYLIKTDENYLGKLDNILRKHFGTEKVESEEKIIPEEYSLYQNYPNPFNPTTIIKYDLPNAGEVSLIIYDILGRKVKTLVNEYQQAGRYEIQFDASNLASGVYLYQILAEDFISTKKMILLR